MMPAGSQRCLTARRSSTPSLPSSRLQPRHVVAPDRVVVGDRRAGGGDRVARRALGGAPLSGRVAAVPAREHGEVERGAVGIEVGDVAADDRRRRREGLRQRVANGAVQRGEPGPRGGGLERLDQRAAVQQRVAQVRGGEARRPPCLARAAPQRQRARRAQRPRGGRAAAGDRRPPRPPSPSPAGTRAGSAARRSATPPARRSQPRSPASASVVRVSSSSDSRTTSGATSAWASARSASHPPANERSSHAS